MEINFKNVKEFVEGRIETAKNYAETRQEVMNCRAISYGAILFAQRNGIATYEEIKEFWDEYAWEEFEKIAREKEVI